MFLLIERQLQSDVTCPHNAVFHPVDFSQNVSFPTKPNRILNLHFP